MNERQNPSQIPRFTPKKKRRGAAVAAVLCFVAAVAVVGTYTFKDFRETQRELELAQAEEQARAQELKERTEEANAFQIVNEKEEDVLAKKVEAAAEEVKEIEEPLLEDVQEEPKETERETAGRSEALSFTNGSKLLWPVEGTLLMNYSMDKTVYFSTLDQFKYNPALVISGEKGDQVISSAPGIVKSIDKTAETGTTINVDIGSGYELFYGQLNDVKVKTGDYVDSKTVLGYVGDPTIYYSVEGSNVYFEMRKDGEPVNPMDYLVE